MRERDKESEPKKDAAKPDREKIEGHRETEGLGKEVKNPEWGQARNSGERNKRKKGSRVGDWLSSNWSSSLGGVWWRSSVRMRIFGEEKRDGASSAVMFSLNKFGMNYKIRKHTHTHTPRMALLTT